MNEIRGQFRDQRENLTEGELNSLRFKVGDSVIFGDTAYKIRGFCADNIWTGQREIAADLGLKQEVPIRFLSTERSRLLNSLSNKTLGAIRSAEKKEEPKMEKRRGRPKKI